jgi:hypothetical protein
MKASEKHISASHTTNPPFDKRNNNNDDCIIMIDIEPKQKNNNNNNLERSPNSYITKSQQSLKESDDFSLKRRLSQPDIPQDPPSEQTRAMKAVPGKRGGQSVRISIITEKITSNNNDKFN